MPREVRSLRCAAARCATAALLMVLALPAMAQTGQSLVQLGEEPVRGRRQPAIYLRCEPAFAPTIRRTDPDLSAADSVRGEPTWSIITVPSCR